MKIKNLKIKPIWTIIGLAFLLITVLSYVFYVDNLEPAALYQDIEKVNGYQITKRYMNWVSTSCPNSCPQYYLYPPGFRECISQGCKFGTFQEAKDYALSLPAYSITTPTPTIVTTLTMEETTNILIWSDIEDATIYIDNINKGKTKTTEYIIIPTSIGTHNIEVKKFGFSTFKKELTIESGNDEKLDVYFQTPSIITPLQTPSIITPIQTSIGCNDGYILNVKTNLCERTIPSLPSNTITSSILIILITLYITKRRKL